MRKLLKRRILKSLRSNVLKEIL